ncbi:hypothetical protein HN709_01710 [Candidatus Peregrinibacteria bacterium]|jgi:serine/threonine protein phosphatase PrpC|nr:hypothetical protein [Candidatus Peregrinibacteria bacterium]MBT7736379.1 hypothetical protein [Candidatus Peregrinibacteria bacterium]
MESPGKAPSLTDYKRLGGQEIMAQFNIGTSVIELAVNIEGKPYVIGEIYRKDQSEGIRSPYTKKEFGFLPMGGTSLGRDVFQRGLGLNAEVSAKLPEHFFLITQSVITAERMVFILQLLEGAPNLYCRIVGQTEAITETEIDVTGGRTIGGGKEGEISERGGKFWGLTEKAGGKSENEDALLVDPKHWVVAVADGVSKSPYGGEAARRVLESVCNSLDLRAQRDEVLPKAVAFLRRFKDLRGSSTTFAIARVFRNPNENLGISMMNVGDAKVIHFSPSRTPIIRYESIDQKFVQTLIDAGSISKIQALESPFSGIINNCISDKGFDCPNFGTQSACKGDVVIVCSDGISGFMSAEEMTQYVLQYGPNAAKQIAITVKHRQNSPDGFEMLVDGKMQHVDVNHGDHISIAQISI